MEILAINGSPRKKMNTAIILNHVLDGAKSMGAKTELVHLYDFNYKGCNSCFACKLINGPSYGRCIKQDDISLLLDRIRGADAFVLGSPVYFNSLTGAMHSFMERLFYPYYVYDKQRSSLFPKRIRTGLILTMNIEMEGARERFYYENFSRVADYMKTIFGAAELQMVYNTYQFSDYSKYYAPVFNEEKKAHHLINVFPMDCQKAFEMGQRLSNPL